MKVCTCLNPLHTALAIFGCLLGFDTIYREMGDKDLCRLVTRMGYEEGMPVVTDPGILSPQEFIKEVLEVRLPNPFMPDTPSGLPRILPKALHPVWGDHQVLLGFG